MTAAARWRPGRYAADVYTIINGGFGARLRDTPQSGMTTSVDYATDVVALPAGKSIRRSFTVTFPRMLFPANTSRLSSLKTRRRS
jgi:hypothetical protein